MHVLSHHLNSKCSPQDTTVRITINSSLLTHKPASILSLMETYVLPFADAGYGLIRNFAAPNCEIIKDGCGWNQSTKAHFFCWNSAPPQDFLQKGKESIGERVDRSVI